MGLSKGYEVRWNAGEGLFAVVCVHSCRDVTGRFVGCHDECPEVDTISLHRTGPEVGRALRMMGLLRERGERAEAVVDDRQETLL